MSFCAEQEEFISKEMTFPSSKPFFISIITRRDEIFNKKSAFKLSQSKWTLAFSHFHFQLPLTGDFGGLEIGDFFVLQSMEILQTKIISFCTLKLKFRWISRVLLVKQTKGENPSAHFANAFSSAIKSSFVYLHTRNFSLAESAAIRKERCYQSEWYKLLQHSSHSNSMLRPNCDEREWKIHRLAKFFILFKNANLDFVDFHRQTY